MPIEKDPNGNGYAQDDEHDDDEHVAGAFNVCHPDWIGDGECDQVCNVTRYNFDCTTPTREDVSPFCDCKPDNVRGTVERMPQPNGGGPADTCADDTNIALLAQHCENVGGRCTGKGGECNGVIRGKCGPDCFCCIGRNCGATNPDGNLTYVGDGICDPECNTEEYHWDGNDCKGTNEEAFSSQDAACPAEWRHDGECDLECRYGSKCGRLFLSLALTAVAYLCCVSLCLCAAVFPAISLPDIASTCCFCR